MFVKAKAVLFKSAILLGMIQAPARSSAAVTIVPWPFADGTIVDENGDGTPEAADYTFDGGGGGLEVAGIQLSRDRITNDVNFESRVFFEYKLNAVTFAPPVLARLTFTLRAATIVNVDGNVQVYSYPSDLSEEDPTLDFSGGPAVLQGAASVSAYESETEFSICVSDAVNAALSAGDAGVAFRFQIDPASEAQLNLAHIDALDAFPETKPYLTVSVPGDANGDRDVDLADLSSFGSCFRGPDTPATNPVCRLLDQDCDGDTDMIDFAAYQASFTGTP